MSSESQPRRIVVGVDRSSVARVALEHAARRVGAGGRVIVAHVVTPLSDAMSRAVSGLEEERDAAARELVDRLAGAYAAQRAYGGGRVIAVHAFQPAPDWLGTPYYQRALDAYQSHGRELLRSLEERNDLGVELATSLLEGPPARAIVAAADARDADEIVIGSRGFGRVRGVLGSVSHAVLHEAERPVVVIPADAV